MGDRRNRILLGSRLELQMRSDPAWDDVLAVEHHRAVPGPLAICHSRAHVIVLHRSVSASMEWRIGSTAAHFALAEGSLSLINRGTRVEWQQPLEAHLLVAALDTVFINGLTGRSVGGQILFPDIPSFADPAVAHIMLALWSELKQGCPAGRIYWESLATALAAHLMQHHALEASDAVSHRGGLPPARLRRVLDYMEARVDEPVSLRDLADVALMSPSHFAKSFRLSTGLPPHRYLTQLRAERAKELLADVSYTLADIALALGYSSQAHFTTMFRKATGSPPGEYRAALLRNAAERESDDLHKIAQ